MNLIRNTLTGAILASALMFASTSQAAEVAYTLDPTHTQVDFRWNHLGFSNPAASFDEVTGTLNWDAANPTRSSVKVTMPLSGLRSRVPLLDQHFRSADYFDAAKYPAVTFESTRVERGTNAGEFRISGKLTVRDITRDVVLDAKLNQAGTHPMLNAPAIGFDATTRIKRSEFGMGAFVPAVSDDIDIRITTEAVEAKAWAEAMKAMAGGQ